MARAYNSGWDFVKVGGIYQYKEDSFIAMVEVLQDISDEKYYDFIVKILAASSLVFPLGYTFNVSHIKESIGYWSGMVRLYEDVAYLMIPFGSPWPYALEGYEYVGIEKWKLLTTQKG